MIDPGAGGWQFAAVPGTLGASVTPSDRDDEGVSMAGDRGGRTEDGAAVGRTRTAAAPVSTPPVTATVLIAVHAAVLAEPSMESALACVIRHACALTGASAGCVTVIGSDGLVELAVPGELADDQVAAVDIVFREELTGSLQISGATALESDQHLEVLHFLAGTTALVIENFRLTAGANRIEKWVRASTEITRTLLGRGNDHTLLDIAGRIKELVDADVVKVVVQVEGSDRMRVEVALLPDGEGEVGQEYPSPATLSRAIIDTGEPVRLADVDQVTGLEVQADDGVRVGPVLGLPLIVAGRPRRALVVGRVRGRPPFTLSELDLGSAFAGQAALALELVDTRRAQDRVARWEDRTRIARDLHDVVIQQVFAAGLTVRALMRPAADPELSAALEQVAGDLDDAIGAIRTSIFALNSESATGTRSVVLDTVAALAATLGRSPLVRFSGPVDTLVPPSLHPDVRAVLSESLTNVARHARADRVDVRIAVRDDQFSIEVADNGIGMAGATRDSGLANLRARAVALGGRLVVESSPASGTSVRWTIPLDP